jgi:BASS family bile acid:Na+ symporter
MGRRDVQPSAVVMTIRDIVILVLQISVFCTVFGFGIRTTPAHAVDVLRRPAVLLRGIAGMFILMPALAILLARLFEFRQTVEIALIAISISPVPPLLPQRYGKAGGAAHFALGLMAILSVLAIVIVPLAVKVVELFFARTLSIGPLAVARIVVVSALLPLGAGMLVAAKAPVTLVEILKKLTALVTLIFLPLAAVLLLVIAAPAIGTLIGEGTIVAIVMFTLAGLAVGHLMGRGDPDQSTALAVSTACRHPAVALSVASANFPDQPFGAAILLYMVVSASVALPYIVWRRTLRSAPAA